MSGGTRRVAQRRCARSWAACLAGGIALAPWSLSPAALFAEEAGAAPAAVVDDCPPTPNEKSIIIEATDLDQSVTPTAAADSDGGRLEPIANVSDYEPELAEPAPTANGAPTLAAEYEEVAETTPGESPVAPGADYAPTSEDVCIDEPEESPQPVAVALGAVGFNGIVPGESKRVDVLSSWGKPARGAGTPTLIYELKNFPTVEVTFSGDRVDAIRVELFDAVDAGALADKLGLADVRPARLYDDDGRLASTVFPERGVEMRHQATGTAAMATDSANSKKPVGDPVYEIAISQITAEPFVARAETCGRRYTLRVADLETALELDSQNAEIRASLAAVKLAVGETAAAERLAAEAVRLSPRNEAYRVAWARCLKRLARYDEAVEQTRQVLESPSTPPLVRAEALEQMAQLAALGGKELQERAIPLHNKAIAIADELAKSDDPHVRAAAKQMLVGAHLAVAERVAAGSWKNKDESVAEWISRASGLSEQMIADGEADVTLRLQVAVSALVAGGRLDPPIDPELWIAEAEQTANELQASCDDPLAQAEIDWQLGLAYSCATDIQHRRGDASNALKYGALAESKIGPLAKSLDETPDGKFVLGRLYFQIGAVHAVHGGDHETACRWYDRSAPLLLEPAPLTPLATPQQHGDALVSMGVSYWQVGQRKKAVELTTAGLEIVEQAIEEQLLTEDAATVARSNLSAMNRSLGRGETATASAGRAQRSQQTASSGRNQGNRASANSSRQQTRMASRRGMSDSGGTQRR